ncbi:MAG: hypothetical protein EBT78_18215, partial [Betaproteobacteria bacterium]|nr:hypothetical protein [Betaproteobacteria bacterium]
MAESIDLKYKLLIQDLFDGKYNKFKGTNMTYPNTQLFINGQWCDAAAGESLAVFNPATGKEIGRVAHARIPD